MSTEKRFLVEGYRWFQKTYGNTYNVVEITDLKNGERIAYLPFDYGYGDYYRQRALEWLAENNYLPEKYKGKKSNGLLEAYAYERENNYPIIYRVFDVDRKKDLP
jgi:hypothetical protein